MGSTASDSTTPAPSFSNLTKAGLEWTTLGLNCSIVASRPNSTVAPGPNWTTEDVTTTTLSGTVRLASTSFLAVLSVLICGGNGLFITAYLNTNKISSTRTNALFFLVQLACADFLVGLSVPYYIAVFWIPRLEKQTMSCAMRYVTVAFPLLASVCCLVLLSIDRCIAVRCPLRYSAIVTKAKVRMVSVAMWAYSILLGIVLPLLLHRKWQEGLPCDFAHRFKWEYFGIVLLPSFLFLSGILVIVYIVIIWTVFQESKKRLHLSGSNTGMETSDTSFSNQNLRVLVTGLLVCGVFYLCWLPFFIILLIQTYTFQLEDKVFRRARTIATVPAFLNSCMNTFIYAWRLSLFQRYIKRILCNRRQNETISNTSNNTSG